MSQSQWRVGQRSAVRKRSEFTRMMAKRGRPKTPAPKNGFLIGELAQLCNLSIRTLRAYVGAGIIQPLEFRGTATRYPRRALLRLLRMIGMRVEGRLRLSEVKRRLDALSDPDLEAWLATQPLAPNVALALGLPTNGASAAPAQRAAPEALHGAAVDTWHRVRLLPGLELLVSADASPAVRAIAQSIHDQYVAPAPSPVRTGNARS